MWTSAERSRSDEDARRRVRQLAQGLTLDMRDDVRAGIAQIQEQVLCADPIHASEVRRACDQATRELWALCDALATL